MSKIYPKQPATKTAPQRNQASALAEEYERIKHRPLILVFIDWFISYSYKDPQAKGYEGNMGEYYKRELILSLDKKLSDEIKFKPFCDMSLQDLHEMIIALKNSTKERLEVASNANKTMLIANSVNFVTTLFLDYIAYFGVENGGCGNDTKGKASESFEQQPIPASAVAGAALMMNIFLALRQDANNHFTEIVENAIVQILQEIVKKASSRNAWQEAFIDDAEYKRIIAAIEREHHLQHFHEDLRFKMRFITAATFVMRGFISADKIIQFVETSFSKEALCATQGITSSEFNAATLQITNLVNTLQGIIRVYSNNKRKQTFENQFSENGIEGIMRLIQGKISNQKIQEILLEIFDPHNPLKLDSHAHHKHHHHETNIRNPYVLEEALDEDEHEHHGHGHGHAHGHSSDEVASWKYYFRKLYGNTLNAFHSMIMGFTGDDSQKKYDELMKNYAVRERLDMSKNKEKLNEEFFENYKKWEDRQESRFDKLCKLDKLIDRKNSLIHNSSVSRLAGTGDIRVSSV